MNRLTINANVRSLLHSSITEFALILLELKNQLICPKCKKYCHECICVMQPQMGAEDQTITSVPNREKVQNVRFYDEEELYETMIHSYTDDTRTYQDTNDASLQNFFSRPIVISETEWSVGANLFYQFDPWSLYFENPRVSNRIANFSLMRCKLHLKFIINGNGFLYSRALASYLPFSEQDTLSQNRVGILNDMVQASQQPHVFLNPTTSKGGKLVLPYFNTTNNTWVPGSNWDVLGKVTVRSFQQLTHANGGTTDVTITVLAWAEDVQLSVLTTVEPDTLSPQMGKEDETDQANKNGMISGPASTISRWSLALSKIPPIAPYALATSKAADAVAGIARIFGYSRPPETKNPCPYKPVQVSSLALTTTPDGTQKLTVDDKQELTIDPRIAGIDAGDPMSIKTIAMRESFLTQFAWNVGTAPGTLLWNARVDPVTWAYTASDGGFHFPACAAAALPFKYWTGTLNFRFQIMCSSFHKGRLKIVYDPNWIATDEYNTNYIQLIDIADENDFTVSITNGQPKTLLSHHLPGVDSYTQLYSTTRYTSKEQGNGIVGVTVQNELTIPNSTATTNVNINVFVSAGEDFEVFVPDDYFASFVFKPQMGFEPQSGVEQPNAMGDNEMDKPEDKAANPFMDTMDPLTNIHKVFTGEVIKSFRPLLKRYNLHSAISAFKVSNAAVRYRSAMFPYLRGNVANAVHQTSASDPYNYCNTVLLHWVTQMYSGWRGSIRYKFIPRGSANLTARLMNWMVQRSPNRDGLPQYDLSIGGWAAYTNSSNAAESVVYDPTSTFAPFHGHNGKAITTLNINPALEFEVPFYSDYRFCPGKKEDYTGVEPAGDQRIPGFEVLWYYLGDVNTLADCYVSAGEDFQVYFFTGLPPLYYEIAPPNPLP